MSHGAAENFIQFNPGLWDVICIVNPGKLVPKPIKEHAKSLLTLIFDDVDSPLESYILPDERDVKEALTFSEGKERLLVTCFGGCSRSAAIAYICLCQDTQSPIFAINHLTPMRHYPNRRIISMAANYLENQDIYKAYNSWVQKPIII
jgi:predicted protein tyrosine phosphatase